MLTNKWVQFVLSLLVGLMGLLAATDWTSLLSIQTAGYVTMAIGVVKMILNTLAPAAGQTVLPTGGTVVTHTTGTTAS